LQEHLNAPQQQAMYGVVHGGTDQALRKMSADYVGALPFDGLAIGGSVGKNKEELHDLLQFIMPHVSPTPSPSCSSSSYSDVFAKPVHLLGIADVQSAVRAVQQGVDTFDSCFPTRAARHGTLLMPKGRDGGLGTMAAGGRRRAEAWWEGARNMNVTNAEFRDAFESPRLLEGLPQLGGVVGMSGLSVGYLRHLFKQHEPVAGTYATLHNLHFMFRFCEEMREAILRDEL